jgi:hypothetical protein
MYTEGNQFQGNKGEHLHRNSRQRPPLHCANCDIDILWPPTIVQGKAYCCTGCAAGGPCNCDYSQYRSVKISGVIYYQNLD